VNMFKLIATLYLVAAAYAVEFEITNRDGGDIWVGILGNGKPDGSHYEHLHNGGFVLGSQQSISINAPDDWQGRFWARTWCDESTGQCLTGNCGRLECAGAGGEPPATLVEITLRGWGGIDYYDISLVDGFNTLATIEPIGGSGDGGEYSCRKAVCEYHINNDCPDELKVDGEHGVIACQSACLHFKNDEYCCSGSHNTPETCKSSDWPVDYPKYFKDRCPDAYSYAYDDHKATFTCLANKYVITLGG
ncbi:uncharacterized protein LOC109607486, partial [Aethina tumida]|uniref:uncharacterized protein LOC109607486 n=1 Tax=Aethina tumida TaxID=116153 RepID=UPI002148815D